MFTDHELCTMDYAKPKSKPCMSEQTELVLAIEACITIVVIIVLNHVIVANKASTTL